MKSLITKKNKHLLWKDELGDDFLLLSYAEVYRYSNNVLRLHIFSWKKHSQIRKMSLILNEVKIDEPFTIVDVKTSNLDKLITLSTFKQRPSRTGKWFKDKEKKLAHKMLHHNPALAE